MDTDGRVAGATASRCWASAEAEAAEADIRDLELPSDAATGCGLKSSRRTGIGCSAPVVSAGTPMTALAAVRLGKLAGAVALACDGAASDLEGRPAAVPTGAALELVRAVPRIKSPCHGIPCCDTATKAPIVLHPNGLRMGDKCADPAAKISKNNRIAAATRNATIRVAICALESAGMASTAASTSGLATFGTPTNCRSTTPLPRPPSIATSVGVTVAGVRAVVATISLIDARLAEGAGCAFWRVGVCVSSRGVAFRVA